MTINNTMAADPAYASSYPVQTAYGQADAAAVTQPLPNHSNLYIKNIPPELDQQSLQNIFAQYGTVETCRVVKPKTPNGNTYGFVKFQNVQMAGLAVQSLNGYTVGSSMLEVKFADSDAGDPRQPQQSASDNLYVRQLPSTYSEQDLRTLFSAFGTIVDCRLLAQNPGDGAAGLVRMGTVEEATRAIQSLNGAMPTGGTVAMTVRYAENENDKKKRTQSRQRNDTRYSPYGQVIGAPRPQLGVTQPAHQPVVQPVQYVDPTTGLPTHIYDPNIYQPVIQSHEIAVQGPCSLYLKNLGPDVDRLWMYEQFSPYGAIRSVKVLEDENKKCKGVGFVNYLNHNDALQAVTAMNGLMVKGAEKELYVSLQQPKT